MAKNDALEMLTDRISVLVCQFERDSSRHGLFMDPVVTNRIDGLMEAVRQLQNLVHSRRQGAIPDAVRTPVSRYDGVPGITD